ncbi:MAG: pentapeptide repeat-containing protein [Pseudomonas profundi]|uniref:pentapeptide repeat-containing protein n=1 Tax=Pseudomonas profundi TaxID=1981513 RepID=UPI00300146DF
MAFIYTAGHMQEHMKLRALQYANAVRDNRFGLRHPRIEDELFERFGGGDYIRDICGFMDRYHCFNMYDGAWSAEYDRRWCPKMFDKQVSVLREAAITGVPLADCAAKRGVDFVGFHFSALVYEEIFSSKADAVYAGDIDFQGIKADGCYMDGIWSDRILSFQGASLREAKFYEISETSVKPGFHAWRMSFQDADLSGADMRFSYLRDCNFMDAAMDDTKLHDSNIFGACFHRVTGVFLLCGPGGKRSDEYRRYWEAVKRFGSAFDDVESDGSFDGAVSAVLTKREVELRR